MSEMYSSLHEMLRHFSFWLMERNIIDAFEDTQGPRSTSSNTLFRHFVSAPRYCGWYSHHVFDACDFFCFVLGIPDRAMSGVYRLSG
jgi:hypothetical protein